MQGRQSDAIVPSVGGPAASVVLAARSATLPARLTQSAAPFNPSLARSQAGFASGTTKLRGVLLYQAAVRVVTDLGRHQDLLGDAIASDKIQTSVQLEGAAARTALGAGCACGAALGSARGVLSAVPARPRWCGFIRAIRLIRLQPRSSTSKRTTPSTTPSSKRTAALASRCRARTWPAS